MSVVRLTPSAHLWIGYCCKGQVAKNSFTRNFRCSFFTMYTWLKMSETPLHDGETQQNFAHVLIDTCCKWLCHILCIFWLFKEKDRLKHKRASKNSFFHKFLNKKRTTRFFEKMWQSIVAMVMLKWLINMTQKKNKTEGSFGRFSEKQRCGFMATWKKN